MIFLSAAALFPLGIYHLSAALSLFMIMLWFFVQNCATDVATLFRQTWVSLRLFVFLSVCPSVRSYCGSENLMLCLPALSVRPSFCPQLLWLLAQAEALPVSTALQYKSRSRDRRSTRSKWRRGRGCMISLGDPARERELELVVFQINIFGFFSVCRLLYNESLVQCFSFSFFPSRFFLLFCRSWLSFPFVAWNWVWAGP